VGQAGGDFLLISDLTTVPRENELISYPENLSLDGRYLLYVLFHKVNLI
jgi:hypothetical protein